MNWKVFYPDWRWKSLETWKPFFYNSAATSNSIRADIRQGKAGNRYAPCRHIKFWNMAVVLGLSIWVFQRIGEKSTTRSKAWAPGSWHVQQRQASWIVILLSTSIGWNQQRYVHYRIYAQCSVIHLNFKTNQRASLKCRGNFVAPPPASLICGMGYSNCISNHD